ncbi:MAG: 16S rRNA (adenine(1518)-N(6)/adenine(1519)-N(6))-dimethyltransferase RsmA [Chloroflexi bacterium]|nr:16S rRNA (adenine(1518)-N(6)/adenine(1519)-N(6))-dimethyltransferase RsmA [Chloroflexota bacterium]MCL5075003.1 16S rRNA (adenine(1518)-N(6)/adenine(1519)-N(6))-dimethyltransferase RsmA [Chloroflexota bacterium]
MAKREREQDKGWAYLQPRADASSLSGIRRLLRQLGLRPRKRLGQNFLVDEGVLQQIVEIADLQKSDIVLEIGPGLGNVTRQLARRAGRVIAVELDPALAKALHSLLSSFKNVEIVNKNILEFDPAELIAAQPYKVVANLPYYITSLVLRHLLESSLKPKVLVLMVQKEVGERITARPGAMSLLSLSIQFYGEPRLVRVIPAAAFYPPPKVDSAIVYIEVYDHPLIDINPQKFFQVAHIGFSQPRKQLRNILARHISLPPEMATHLLREANIDETRRAQTLTLEEWAKLCQVLEKRGYV